MKLLKSNALSLIALFTMAGFSALFYNQLPDSIATKFDFNGNPTQYSSKEFVALLMPIVFIVLIVLINVFIKKSPYKYSMPNSQRAMDITVFGSGLLLLGIHIGMLVDPGGQILFHKFLSLGIALFLIIVGNIFGKTERNFFLGIRIPWTLASETNWKATHRLAGKLMVISGILLLAVTAFYSSITLAIACLLVPTLTPIYYSYRFYVKNERPQEKLEA